MRNQHVPNYISKLKIKKEETIQQQLHSHQPLSVKKLTNNFTTGKRRRFFEDPTIDMKPE
jgi:hypothetical protein